MSADLIHRIALRTMEYPYKVWGFGEGIALEALWEAGRQLDTPEYQRFVIGLLEHWLRRQPPLVEADHSAPGSMLLTAYEASGEARYLDRALALAKHMMALPQAPTKARFHRPLHADYSTYIYVDCMEVDAPFFCQLASVTGEEAYYDFAAEQLLGYAALLFNDEVGLFYHQYDGAIGQINGVFWGRGNGWALLGYLKTLRLLPKAHFAYTTIAEHFTQLATSLARFQHPDGTWSTVLNHPETYREASLPAMLGYGIQAGIAAGLLPDSFTPVVSLAWDATQKNLTLDGLLQGMSVATPPGYTAQHYDQIATGTGFPWGQGPALLFAMQSMLRPI